MSDSKTAMVTGAGRGLGSSLALHLGKLGYSVVVHYNQSRSGAEGIVDRIREAGGQASAFKADLSSMEQAQWLMNRIEVAFGRLDVLVNNVGVYQEKGLLELSEAEWFAGLNSTVTAAYFSTRAALPFLRKSGHGRIINIGDSSCDRPGTRDMAMSYHIGKTGVYMLTRSFAASEAVHGITVNMISPGYLENSVGKPDVGDMPAGRFGTFEDIQHALDFILKEENSYLSGSNLVLSGGWNLR